MAARQLSEVDRRCTGAGGIGRGGDAIRECMGMHNKHGGDMPFHSGGNERLHRACMATRGHHG